MAATLRQGRDAVRFSYTATDGVTVFKDSGTGWRQDSFAGRAGGRTAVPVQISGGGYGFSFVAVPGKSGWFYGATDGGPNADDVGPTGQKVFTDPTFIP